MPCCRLLSDNSLRNVVLYKWNDNAIDVTFIAETSLEDPFVSIKNVGDKKIDIGLIGAWSRTLNPNEEYTAKLYTSISSGTRFGLSLALKPIYKGEYRFEVSCGASGVKCTAHTVTVYAREGIPKVEVVDLRLPNSAEPNTDVNGKLCVRNNGAVDATDVEIPIKAWVNGKRDEFYDITWTVDRVNAGETVCTDIYVTVGGKGSYKFCADSKCVVVSVDKHGPIWPFDIDVFKNIPKEIAIPVAVGVGLASVVGLAVIVSKK